MKNRELTEEEVFEFNRNDSDLQLIGIADSHYYFHSSSKKKILYQEKSGSKVMIIAENIIGSSIQNGRLIMKDDNGVVFTLQKEKKNIVQLDLDQFYKKKSIVRLDLLNPIRFKRLKQFNLNELEKLIHLVKPKQLKQLVQLKQWVELKKLKELWLGQLNLIQLKKLDQFCKKDKDISSYDDKFSILFWEERYLVLAPTWEDKMISLIEKYDGLIVPLYLSSSWSKPYNPEVFGWYIYKLNRVIFVTDIIKVFNFNIGNLFWKLSLVTYNKMNSSLFHYFFYNENKKKLYCYEENGKNGSFIEILRLPVRIEKAYQTTEGSMVIITDRGICYLINDAKRVNNEFALFAVTDVWLENNKDKEFSATIDALLARKENEKIEKLSIAEIADYDRKTNLLIPKHLGDKLLIDFSYSIQRYYYLDSKNKLFYVRSSEFDYRNFKIIGNEENNEESKIHYFKHDEFSIIEFEHPAIDSYRDLQFFDGKIMVTDSRGWIFIVSELSPESQERAHLIAVNEEWMSKEWDSYRSSFPCPTDDEIDEIIEVKMGNYPYIIDQVITFKGKSWIGWYDQKIKEKIRKSKHEEYDECEIFQFIKLEENDSVDDFNYLGLGWWEESKDFTYLYVFNWKKKKLVKVLMSLSEESKNMIEFSKTNKEYLEINVLFTKDRIISLRLEESINFYNYFPIIEAFDSLILNGCHFFDITKDVIEHYKTIVIDFIGDDDEKEKNVLNIHDLPFSDFDLSSDGSDLIIKHKNRNSEIIVTRYEKEVSLSFIESGENFILKHGSIDCDEPNLSEDFDQEDLNEDVVDNQKVYSEEWKKGLSEEELKIQEEQELEEDYYL